jgi:hypothetical protein
MYAGRQQFCQCVCLGLAVAPNLRCVRQEKHSQAASLPDTPACKQVGNSSVSTTCAHGIMENDMQPSVICCNVSKTYRARPKEFQTSSTQAVHMPKHIHRNKCKAHTGHVIFSSISYTVTQRCAAHLLQAAHKEQVQPRTKATQVRMCAPCPAWSCTQHTGSSPPSSSTRSAHAAALQMLLPSAAPAAASAP